MYRIKQFSLLLILIYGINAYINGRHEILIGILIYNLLIFFATYNDFIVNLFHIKGYCEVHYYMKYIDDIDIRCNKKTKQLFYKMLVENCLNENVYIIHKNGKQYQTYQSILILDRLSDNLIEEYDCGDYVVVSDKDLPFDNNYEL